MQSCFKRRSSDATKIRRFFHLCKYFYIVLIISHLSLPFAFSAQSQNCVSKKERLLKHSMMGNMFVINLLYTYCLGFRGFFLLILFLIEKGQSPPTLPLPIFFPVTNTKKTPLIKIYTFVCQKFLPVSHHRRVPQLSAPPKAFTSWVYCSGLVVLIPTKKFSRRGPMPVSTVPSL